MTPPLAPEARALIEAVTAYAKMLPGYGADVALALDEACEAWVLAKCPPLAIDAPPAEPSELEQAEAPWSCDVCGAPGRKAVGPEGYCDKHWPLAQGGPRAPAPSELAAAEAWARGMGFERDEERRWSRPHSGIDGIDRWFLVGNAGGPWWHQHPALASSDNVFFSSDAALIAAWKARPEAKLVQEAARASGDYGDTDVLRHVANAHADRLDTHERLLNAIHDRLAALEKT